MAAIVSSNFRVLNANNFKEDVTDSSVYVAIGKSDVWSNSTSITVDGTPTTPADAKAAASDENKMIIGGVIASIVFLFIFVIIARK